MVFIQWVPAHSNIHSNDLADRAEKEGTIIESDTIHPTPVSCAFQVINDLFCNDPPSHVQISKICQQRKASIDLKQLQSRKDDVLIARLCSGHHLRLKAHHHWTDLEIDPACSSYQQADHTLTHWLFECPAENAIRQQVFENHQESRKWLTTRPGDVIAFARKTLVDIDA